MLGQVNPQSILAQVFGTKQNIPAAPDTDEAVLRHYLQRQLEEAQRSQQIPDSPVPPVSQKFQGNYYSAF